MNVEALLRELARGGPRGWEAWLPALLVANADPSRWAEALGALSDDDQYSLLDRLREDGGPYADGIILTFARSPGGVVDAQIRQFLLGDGVEAADRRLAGIERWRDQLSSGVSAAETRQSHGRDLAAEVARLEKRLTELRMQAIDSEYERMQELESEVIRLETFQESLLKYDRSDREAHSDRLAEQTRELESARATLEGTIAGLLADRDRAESALTLAQERAEIAQAECARFEDDLSSANELATAATVEATSLNQQVNEVGKSVSATRNQQAELRKALLEERRRLTDLETSPIAVEAKNLDDSIRALYERLPADEAESKFTKRPRGVSREWTETSGRRG